MKAKVGDLVCCEDRFNHFCIGVVDDIDLTKHGEIIWLETMKPCYFFPDEYIILEQNFNSKEE